MRKYVQIDKSSGYVNLIGDEELGMSVISEDSDLPVWAFSIENHPQNAEIEQYMLYDKETDTFYFPEPTEDESDIPPMPTLEEKVDMLINAMVALLNNEPAEEASKELYSVLIASGKRSIEDIPLSIRDDVAATMNRGQ